MLVISITQCNFIIRTEVIAYAIIIPSCISSGMSFVTIKFKEGGVICAKFLGLTKNDHASVMTIGNCWRSLRTNILLNTKSS